MAACCLYDENDDYNTIFRNNKIQGNLLTSFSKSTRSKVDWKIVNQKINNISFWLNDICILCIRRADISR